LQQDSSVEVNTWCPSETRIMTAAGLGLRQENTRKARRQGAGQPTAWVKVWRSMPFPLCRLGSSASTSAAYTQRHDPIVLGESVNTLTSYATSGHRMHEGK